MSLWKMIHEAAKASPEGDPKKIASQLLSRTKREQLLQLLTEEVQKEQRGIVLTAERETFNELFSSRTDGPTAPASITFKALASEVFALGDGIKVGWTEATVEQHEQRIAFLKKMRDGIDATILRHEEAVRLIRENGVTCLADLDAEAA